jgi:hypothetical protein
VAVEWNRLLMAARSRRGVDAVAIVREAARKPRCRWWRTSLARTLYHEVESEAIPEYYESWP